MKTCLFAMLMFLPVLAPAAGTTGAEVMKIRPGARAVALGETYAALGDDIFSVFYNPAGLTQLKKVDISFLHWASVADVAYETFGYAQPFSFGSLGFCALYRHMPDINNPRALDPPVSSNDVLMSVSYAQSPARLFPGDMPERIKDIQAGVSLKFLRSHLGSTDTATGAADIGVRTALSEGLTGAVSLLNLGPPLKYIDVPDALPAEILVGLSQSLKFSQNSSLSVNLDLEQPMDGTSRLHTGVEAFFLGSLALRAGYIVEDQRSLGGMTGGMGIWLEQPPLLFKLDYAFRPMYYGGFNSFEPQHIMSLGLGF